MLFSSSKRGKFFTETNVRLLLNMNKFYLLNLTIKYDAKSTPKYILSALTISILVATAKSSHSFPST